MVAVEVPQTLEYMGGQLNAAPVLEDFQDSPDDKEDTRSSHQYLNDLEEEYKARALLSKSKRFFKKGTQRFSGTKATYQTECHKYDKKDKEEVSSDDNEVTEVKALIEPANEERNSVSKESASNGEWVKISIKKAHTLLEMEDNDDRKSFLDYMCIDLNYVEEQRNNLINELKELSSIIEAWLNSSNKVNHSEQIPTQKKKILGIDQLTKDTSSSVPKDLVFVKSLTDDSEVSITGSNKPKLSEAEDSTLSNHDAGKVPSNESQRNTADHSVVVSDSSTIDYDSANESSVCNKSSSASKTNSAPAGKLKNVKIEDDPPLAIVMKELNKLKLQISKNKLSYFRNKNSQQYHTGQGESSSRSRPSKPVVPFPFCKHYGYNDHKSDDYLYYLVYEICGSYDHDTHGHNWIISLRRGIKSKNHQHVIQNCKTCSSNVYTISDHNDIEWFKKREAL
nr:hypothetical protein [Tanacetum cinerariifolium]